MRPRAVPARPDRRSPLPFAVTLVGRPAPTRPVTPPTHDIVRNGYTYRLDDADRTVRVTGTLTLTGNARRSRPAQAQAGGRDRLPSDDGGHYVAVRFNGPTDAFNHFAQDANFNRGGYRALEDKWAAAAKQGKKVYVAVRSVYAGRSRRPSEIMVVYTINGARTNGSFPNISGKFINAR